MTALAAVFVPSGFVVAADGRCRSDDATSGKEHETDHAQKIFAIENDGRTLAYSLIGFAGTNDGKFKMMDEIRKVAETLANRRFDDCVLYVHKFCHNLQRVISKAQRDGRISEFPTNEHLPPDRRNSIFRLLIVGYFKREPWKFEVRFFRNDQNKVRPAIDSCGPLVSVDSAITGSEIIANALYVGRDPRFARYNPSADTATLDWAAAYARGYIDACSDPTALTLDPLCNNIGGHVHIAEITLSDGFKWRIPPLLSAL